MLFAISGSQGVGKSWLLSDLSDRGFNTITRKTSRSILTDWNVTLDEVNSDRELSIKFQEEIILRKHQDEFKASISDQMWFTERTYADIFTYALITLGVESANNEWLGNYYRQCVELQTQYKHVFYINGGKFPVEYDGVRGSNPHFAKMVDVSMKTFTSDITLPTKLSFIDSADMKDRVGTVLERVFEHKTQTQKETNNNDNS